MSFGKVTLIVFALAAVVAVLFEVDFVFDIALAHTVMIPDPKVEAEYQRCYAARDHQIHETAFGTIDNPDVQREYINAHREKARQDCRKQFPESMIESEEPMHFNLIDLKPRFW